MKLRILLMGLLLMNLHYAGAQEIYYEKSLEDAREEAMKNNKPVAILITAKIPGNIRSKQDAMHDIGVINKFNTHFINYRADREDAALTGDIIKKYKIRRFPSFVFLDAKSGFLFTDVARMAFSEDIHALLDKALMLASGTSMVEYDSSYKAGNRSAAFLKGYIQKRQSAGITNNAGLAEDYVNAISIADLNNYQEVLFILKAGPIVDSNAYRLASINKKITDSIYRSEPYNERVAMNNIIIGNSIDLAILQRNKKRAFASAQFAKDVWGKDSEGGIKAWHSRMLQYYIGTKDTVEFIRQASGFYDRYYMKLSIDSLRRKDSLRLVKAKAGGKVTEVYDSTTKILKRRTEFPYSKNNADAIVLNHVAWDFYNMTAGPEHLSKAMLWVKRAIELDPRPAYYDTYAHILYKLSMYAEAESMQKKAIELAKTERIDSSGFEAALKKMITKTL